MTKTSCLSAIAGVGILWSTLCGPTHADLINHWKFDETSGTTAVDSGNSSNLLNLDLKGDAHFVNDATRGQVLALDGNGDYASNSGEPFDADMNHTVAAWVNHYDAGPLYQGLISWGTNRRYFVGTHNSNGGRIFTGFGAGSAMYFTHNDAEPLEDTWQYWTIVRQGTSVSLYLDGQWLQTLTVSNGGSIDTTGELRIGRQFADYTCYLHGQMDDMAIWNEPLTKQQINNAMNLGAENYQVPEPSSIVLLLLATLGGLAVLRTRRTARTS